MARARQDPLSAGESVFPDVAHMTEPFPGLSGAIAVVTGGGSSTDPVDAGYPGTGFAISVLLASSGSRVAVLDRDLGAAQRTCRFIEENGGDAFALECDVSEEVQVGAAMDAVVEHSGRIDCLVNNVGVMADSKPVSEVPDQEWDRIFGINVRGSVYAVRHAKRAMRVGSSIVNISSTTALRPHRNRGVYPVTKGAVNSLTTSLAVDLGPDGIRVNAVAPGSIWTPLGRNVLLANGGNPAEVRKRRARESTLLQQAGTAWDVAGAVSFLCSNTSRWITGQVLVVDGGGSVLWGSRPLPVDAEVKQ